MAKTKKVLVRRMRHWKQRFEKNAEFIWRRSLIWDNPKKPVKIGSPIPKTLKGNPTKLRRFWESGVIELAEFEAPNVATGQVEIEEEKFNFPIPESVTITKGKATWYSVEHDSMSKQVNGLRNLEAWMGKIFTKEEDEVLVAMEKGDVDNDAIVIIPSPWDKENGDKDGK